jgi:hypothetical protein
VLSKGREPANSTFGQDISHFGPPPSPMRRQSRVDAGSWTEAKASDIEDLSLPARKRVRCPRIYQPKYGKRRHNTGFGSHIRKCMTGLGNSPGTGTNGPEPFELVRMVPDCREFSNAKGCTVRYNPFQHEDQLEYFNVTGMWTDANSSSAVRGYTEIMNTDDIQMPCIVVKFSEHLDTAQPYPFKLHCCWWMESELVLPTPIFSDRSPCDPNFEQIRAIASDTTEFPVVVEGHSFRPWQKLVMKFFDHVVNDGDLVSAATKAASGAGRIIVRGARKKVKKRIKKKFPKKKARPRYRKVAGNSLPGTVSKDASRLANVPNV